MAEFCRLSPVVKVRKGTKIEEVDSKFFERAYEYTKDRELSWDLWAYATLPETLKKFEGKVELDELGEPTFPSFMEVIGLGKSYKKGKKRQDVIKDYKFDTTNFTTGSEAVRHMDDFNDKEDDYTAVVRKQVGGYRIDVDDRNGKNMEEAHQQSFNNALNREIIGLLNSLGFSAVWVNNPKYAGLFDPSQAKLYDGTVAVIRLARGERGEKALPEEFAHLLIEGMGANPLVMRLLANMTMEQVERVLGDSYAQYSEKYEGDEEKLKKEAAGKMLGEYIVHQGTLDGSVTKEQKPLLSRIWNWIKGIFGKVTDSHLDSMRTRAENDIRSIYKAVASGDLVSLVDNHAVLSADYFYQLDEKYNTAEKLARAGKDIVATMRKLEMSDGNNVREATKVLNDIKDYIEGDKYFESLVAFLHQDVHVRIEEIKTRIDNVKGAVQLLSDKKLNDLRNLNELARLSRQINRFVSGYKDILTTLSILNTDDNWLSLSGGIEEDQADSLADIANMLLQGMNSFIAWDAGIKRKIMYNMVKTMMPHEKVRGIGSNRDLIMSVEQIVDHADRDINLIDRWFSAMSDADDALLTIIDGLVKNQKYQRDIEAEEWRTKIAYLDKELKDAGYDSDFMYERKKDDPSTPTGRIISIYDWDTYIEARDAKIRELRAEGYKGNALRKELRTWKTEVINGESRTIRFYINPEVQAYYENTNNIKNVEEKYEKEAIYEELPNPKFFTANANRIEQLAPAQRKYYDEMMAIKREMMRKIPHRGQSLYRAVYVSKDFVEGVLDNSTGNIGQAILDHYARKFIRRPDDIGFGIRDNFSDTIKNIIKANTDDSDKASRDIVQILADSVDADIIAAVNPRALKRIIDSNQGSIDVAVEKILLHIESSDFYIVDVDFNGDRVQRLPVYYTRRLHNMKMLSTDFSATLTSYMAMAVNYNKMNEVVDILEVARNYVNERRVREVDGGKSVISQFSALGEAYRHYVTAAGSETNIAGRLDEYMSSAVYEERKKNEGVIPGVNLDIAKTVDTIKDYTGLLGLGFNLFSMISNVSVGKLQQWIEAAGGEYFGLKDYAWAVGEYHKLLPGYLAEMGSNVKKNKLSLLIQMFDPMGDYFDSVRNSDYNNSALSKIMGNGLFAYLGMNAGEHILHCQTMLAMLHATKLKDAEGNEISLYDALEVKEVEGITKLVLKEGLHYEKEMIDNTGTQQTNKNYGKYLRNEDGSIRIADIELKDIHDNVTQKYIIRIKRGIRKVNDSLNGAFGVDDKGAIQRRCLGRMMMQFRQWMIAHYERRFSRAHYDNDLEQWREGYYITAGKQILIPLYKDLVRGKMQFAKYGKLLSRHEKANLRRALAEVTELALLATLIKVGGKVKDRSRNWLEKMGLYQLHRMFLDVGASCPITPQFFSNIFTLLQSPAASLDTFENLMNVIKFWDIFDEVQTGRYQGWSVYEKNMYQLVPALDQIDKAVVFDDSMFSIFDQ